MPGALIFSMYQHLVDFSDYTPVAQNGPASGGHVFNIGLDRGKMKTSPCLKPLGLEP